MFIPGVGIKRAHKSQRIAFPSDLNIVNVIFYDFFFFLGFIAEPLPLNVTVDADTPFEDEQLVGGAVDPPWDSPDTSKCF